MSRLLTLLCAVVRRTWVLASITVVCFAVFAARAAAALVDASYLLPLPATAPQRPAGPPPPPRARPKDGPLVEIRA